MEKIFDLEKEEMLKICGGVNPAYDVGYIVGSSFRHFLNALQLLEIYDFYKNPYR
jgi:hypothetical protein